MTSHDAMDGERVALQGGGGRAWEGEGRGTPQEGNLTQRCGEAESAEIDWVDRRVYPSRS